jgi:hypothetical protein
MSSAVRLDHPGIEGQTSINGMQAHLLHQTHHSLTRLAIITTDEHITVNGVFKLTEFMRWDVLESRYHFHTLTQDFLGLLRGWTSCGHQHLAGIFRIQRDTHVNQDFPLEMRLHRLQGAAVCRERHGQGHYIRRYRSVGVGHALDAGLAKLLIQLSGYSFGSRLLSGANNHLHPSFGPAQGHARSLLAGAP